MKKFLTIHQDTLSSIFSVSIGGYGTMEYWTRLTPSKGASGSWKMVKQWEMTSKQIRVMIETLKQHADELDQESETTPPSE